MATESHLDKAAESAAAAAQVWRENGRGTLALVEEAIHHPQHARDNIYVHIGD